MSHAPLVAIAAVLLLTACQQPAPARSTGGPRWIACPTGGTASLRGLAVVDADVVWVGGTAGTLLRTDDGGRTWRDVAPPDSAACDFRDIEAFDADTALAMVAGQPARIYRTGDGGASWQVVHEDPRPAAFFDAMAFLGERGVLLGDPIDGAFAVLVTEDRGRSWRAIEPGWLPAPAAGEAAFAASGTCIAFAAQADPVDLGFVLVRFATGGGSSRYVAVGPEVRAVPLPLAGGSASRGAFGLAFAPHSDRDVVAVGGDYQEPAHSEGTAAWSNDGGATWQPAAAGGYRSAAVWLAGDRVLAVGSHGASVSDDRGRTWRSFGEQGFHSVAIGRDASVFACGSGGRVARLQTD
ncbi:MAG TPA: oxidoreductase [Planctomycetota bacterium]|nr:oxidoreductase [Planctomycetota bacterium]